MDSCCDMARGRREPFYSLGGLTLKRLSVEEVWKDRLESRSSEGISAREEIMT